MAKDVIIALDFENKSGVENFLKGLEAEKPYLKVGMELYYKLGFDYVKELKSRGFKIFLDLKLHDIENTVVKTMKVLKELDVELINLHATVGLSTMKRVEEVFRGTNTKVIGVTVLTSIDEEAFHRDLNHQGTIEAQVLHLAKLVKKGGLAGVVCSPLEVELLKKELGKECLCVTPGIRYKAGSDDQKRIMTPEMAGKVGSDYIVVGRLITESQEPLVTYRKVKTEFLGGQNEL